MPDPAILRALFDRPPTDAIAFLKSKGLGLTWNFQEMQDDAHARTFTVVKAGKLDILSDIRGALVDTLNAGGTLDDFNRDLIPTLRAKGWWGRQVAVDPDTLDAELVQLGSVRRLKTIYQTNMQSAYMAGRYKRQMEADAFPFLQYVAVMDSKTRPSHSLLHGKIWRKDDPVWDTISPPRGYNCRCRTRALTPGQIEREGLTVSPPAETVSREVDFGVNKITGEAFKASQTGVKVKDATGKTVVSWTDAGFSGNPGKAARWDVRGHLPDCDGPDGLAALAQHAVCIAPYLGGMFPEKTWRDYGRPDLRAVPLAQRIAAPALLNAGASRAAATEILAAALGVSRAAPLRIVDTPVEPVRLDYDWLPHMAGKPEHGRERYGGYILPTLEQPFEVWLTAYPDGYRKRYIGLFGEKNDLMAIVRENRDGTLMWNIMQSDSKSLNKARLGALIYGR